MYIHIDVYYLRFSLCFILFRIYKQYTKKRLQKVVLLQTQWMNLITNHCSSTWQNRETGVLLKSEIKSDYIVYMKVCD